MSLKTEVNQCFSTVWNFRFVKDSEHKNFRARKLALIRAEIYEISETTPLLSAKLLWAFTLSNQDKVGG